MGKTSGKWAGPGLERAFWLYLSTLVRVTSWKVASALALMVCLSLTEGIGLLLLVPLLQLVGLEVQQGSIGRLARFVSSIFTAIGVRPTLITVLGVYVLIVSTHALLYRWQTTANLALEHEFVVHLRQRLYRTVTNTNWLFFSRSRASDFTHALTTEMSRIGMATHFLLLLIVNAITTSVYLFLALRLSAVMTGLVFACGAGVLLLLKGKMQVARLTGKEISLVTSGLYAAAIDHLGGMKTAKSYGAEERTCDIFSKLSERVAHVHLSAVRNQAEVKCWFDIGAVLILSLNLYVAFEVLAIPTAGVLLLLFLFARVMPKFSTMQQSYQSCVHQLPAFAAVMEMQARCEAAAEPQARSLEEVELRQGIRFAQVSFGYEGEGKAPVIDALDLLIPAGETTAIVGSSGAGKSTIADLVMGLIVPDQGRVLVDETPLGAERLRAWRDQIGYVAQDTFLFHDTVHANLLWARPDASDEEISRALSLAAAEEFVLALPQGGETVLGDRGVRLSGGERQRLALARALLRRPSLLILDEATSALDSENERRIQRAIEELRGRMTILLISHRLSTLRGADTIHVLEHGRVVEAGAWDELIAKENGRCRALCRAQGIDMVRIPDKTTHVPLLSF